MLMPVETAIHERINGKRAREPHREERHENRPHSFGR